METTATICAAAESSNQRVSCWTPITHSHDGWPLRRACCRERARAVHGPRLLPHRPDAHKRFVGFRPAVRVGPPTRTPAAARRHTAPSPAPPHTRCLPRHAAASPDEALAYLSAVGSGGRVVILVTNPFGSHVVEDLLRALGAPCAYARPALRRPGRAEFPQASRYSRTVALRGTSWPLGAHRPSVVSSLALCRRGALVDAAAAAGVQLPPAHGA